MQQRIIPVRLGSSINEALSSVQDDGSDIVLLLEEGIYREKVVINHRHVTLIGAGRTKTRISYDDAASTVCDGMPLGTFASATLTVNSAYFVAEHLTIANDFDYPSHRYLVEQNPGKVKGLQAVAFRTTEAADHTVLRDCAFFGYQDTLLLDAGSHFLSSCTVEGNIDFIFGAGKAFFETCTIVSNGSGYVTAPSTKKETLGFCFHRCKFTRNDTVEALSVYLGRPWHPGADENVNSFAMLYDCYLDDHIHPDGWTWMHAFPPEGGEVVFTAEDSRFYETSSRGPGSSQKRFELSQEEVMDYLKLFIEC